MSAAVGEHGSSLPARVMKREIRDGKAWYPLPLTQEVFAAFYRVFLHRPLLPPEAPRFVFLIPLVGRKQAGDWDVVVDRLRDTLASIDAQSCADRRVVICGQDKPAGFPRDQRDMFLQASAFSPVGRSKTDRARKSRQIARALHALVPGFSYVVIMDADDILHPDLCAYIARDNNGRGYLIDRGWMVGPKGGVAPLTPEPGHYAFWEYCGTCAIVAVDTERQWLHARYLSRFVAHHHVFGRMAEAHGYPLDPVPFPAALYLFNHGSNTSVLHGRAAGKQEYMRHHVLPPEERRMILAEFSYNPTKTASAVEGLTSA
ncbi:MAG: glycosyltransferase family 2 protein [Pseudomonadota bacterium]